MGQGTQEADLALAVCISNTLSGLPELVVSFLAQSVGLLDISLDSRPDDPI